jgi:hypothetical protein
MARTEGRGPYDQQLDSMRRRWQDTNSAFMGAVVGGLINFDEASPLTTLIGTPAK